MSRSIRYNVTLVTGALDPVGRALAARFAGRTAWLLLADRDAVALREMAERFRRITTVIPIPADTATPDGWREIEQVLQRLPRRLDAAVIHAGGAAVASSPPGQAEALARQAAGSIGPAAHGLRALAGRLAHGAAVTLYVPYRYTPSSASRAYAAHRTASMRQLIHAMRENYRSLDAWISTVSCWSFESRTGDSGEQGAVDGARVLCPQPDRIAAAVEKALSQRRNEWIVPRPASVLIRLLLIAPSLRPLLSPLVQMLVLRSQRLVTAQGTQSAPTRIHATHTR